MVLLHIYDYDALNRMDGENAGSAVTYTYDANNNRLTKVAGSTTTTTVPSNSNKISAVGGSSYTYDSTGNITADGTNTYVWSAAGLLKESKVSGSTVGAYTYDSQNHRAKKVAGGNTIHYVYGAGGLLYGEYDNSGVLIREYIYLNGAPLAQIDKSGGSEVLTYLHPDHLGTPRFGTNTGGTQVWAWNSDAFGVGSPSGSATVNLRMPGQYFDSESGLFYNWNRYYNPAIGRYISSDPIGLDGGLNTFNYTNVSPVMYVDPEGLAWGTKDFVVYYILPENLRKYGNTVHLGDIGLLELFKNHPSVVQARAAIFDAYEKEIVSSLRQKCAGKTCPPAGKERTWLDKDIVKTDKKVPGKREPYNVAPYYNLLNPLFSLQNGTLFSRGTCNGEMDCISMRYTGMCNLHFYVRDEFKDPFNIADNIPALDGDIRTPYNIHADWDEKRTFE